MFLLRLERKRARAAEPPSRIRRRNREGAARAPPCGHPSPPPPRRGLGAIGGEVCEALARLPTPAEQHARIESWANYFRRRVKDPKLRVSPCLKLASALVEGRVPEAAAMRILAYIDEHRAAGTLMGEPWMYFTGTVKKLLSQAESVPAWRDTGE